MDAAYTYSTGTAVEHGDFVTVTTGSAKDGTLRRANGYVVDFSTQDIPFTRCMFKSVTVQIPNGGGFLESAPSRLALISR